MKVAIVKYSAGNVESVKNALNRLGVEPVLTDRAEGLQRAERVIFPGVGEASSAMRYLREKRLDETIKNLRQPVLGVCLGMQLLGKFSEENETECLGIVPFRVRRFDETGKKVPHMGWNQIGNLKSKLFADVAENSFVYFVHSFFVEPSEATVAAADYGETFSAAVNYRNFYGVQFHTEKSGEIGQKILQNFLNLND